MNNDLPTEIEATFVDIDKENLREKLKLTGAKLIQPEILMQRTVFDVDKSSFIRVRDEGNKITLSYKHSDGQYLSGMKEICLEVNDYDAAIQFVLACGYRIKSKQETYREEWELDGVEIDLDAWPWIPSYAEIEGPSEEQVKEVSEKLGFNMEDALYGSADDVYKLYYDVTSDDINYCPEIKFTEIPDWLAVKRKTK